MTNTGSSLRVLIVDDCPDNAQLLAILLRKLGNEVRTAHNAAAAISAAGEFKPDIAMLDIAMPDTDGYSLARELRQSPHLGGIRLIAVSGYADQTHKDLAVEAGFDAYLVKPYSIDELSEAIELVRSR